MVFRLGFVSSR